MKANDVRDKQPVKITLGGVEHELKFTLNALAELEERYGTVDAAFAKLDENSIKAVRCVLWAGMLHEENPLTEQQVGNLIDLDYLQEMTENLGQALSGDMPQVEEEVTAPNA